MCEASACLLSPVLFYTSHYGLSIAAGTIQHWWRLEGFVGCDLLISALTHTHTHTNIQCVDVFSLLSVCRTRSLIFSLTHTKDNFSYSVKIWHCCPLLISLVQLCHTFFHLLPSSLQCFVMLAFKTGCFVLILLKGLKYLTLFCCLF